MDKLINCGCGGKPRIAKKILMGNLPDVYVFCENCSIRTREYYSVAEAITAWNTAMGERTAKVEDIQVEWGDDEYINDRMGDMYHYGNCGNCGETVSHNQKYCHHCGARLEWE